MTSLRQQMIDAMVLRGLAGRTQECYVAVVAQLASYYHCSPDRLDAAQVKAWLLHRISERHLAYATINQAVCAIKFLFSAVLGREADAIAISYARTPQRQPEILSREELARLFDSAGNLRSRTLLMTTYAAGLRVSEVCALRVADIDSAPDRMCIRVVEGKGGKDRYTLLTPCLLEALRQYWRLCKPRLWLFPRVSDPAQPFDICCAQRAYHRARERAGQSHLPSIATVEIVFTVIHLRRRCSQPRNLCSFLAFWVSHDDEGSDAAHVSVCLDFRPAQRTPGPARSVRVADRRGVFGSVQRRRVLRHRGVGQRADRLAARLSGA